MHGTLRDQGLIYLQIAQMVEDNILRHVYEEEEQVPSTNELARLYNINPATAAKGLNLLVAEEILYKRRGLGMFVSKGAGERILQKRRTQFATQYVAPMVAEGMSLGLTKEGLFAMIERVIERGES